MNDDARWMGAALALGARGRGRTWPNPNVGCVVVSDGRVVGRGWTQAGGRPHAEAVALTGAGASARGATLFTTLEPCAHISVRGPACCDVIVDAGVARVVAAICDPDTRTDGAGFARLGAAGIDVMTGVCADAATRQMAGFLTRRRRGRPYVTLKLALSLDGAAAMADGRSQWITGAAARAHGHVERMQADAILVGRGTWEHDAPRLNVRLSGLEAHSPTVVVLSASHPEPAVRTIASPSAISELNADWLLVEGGMATASSFLREDLVDRLLLYRAPILIGGGRTLGPIGLGNLHEAHGHWIATERRRLGSDTLDVYERVRS